MKAFHTIAVPHKDILSGRLTMDVFAADLWEVKQNRGPIEYKDPDTFFSKTYTTGGLDNLLKIVQKRLNGLGGDPVIQIQTPFGGGKTHSLIALYHKTFEWSAKKVVIVGTAIGTDKTLWGLMEEQLTGKINKLAGQISPGREAIRELLSDNQPILILIDEILEYATKAAGVIVGKSDLGAQTTAFLHELTETVSTLEKACLVITLPSSLIEHYDQSAEVLYQKLQKIAGRIEKIYTPVEESEITKIIRTRLFSDINEKGQKEIVSNFIKYAEKENLLPADMKSTEYRDKFLDSYPFMPEVIDILYQRWGSFTTFQRTRGVLRLLSLVINSLKETDKPYITLADFDLSNQEIRQELLKHIGTEFNSVIAADITDSQSGAKKVNLSVGKAYQGLKLGSRACTSIFLYSFSGGQEKGASLNEIKRSATIIDTPSSVVAETAEQLKTKLFYLQTIGEKYFFTNQANLNRILINYINNVKDDEIMELEKTLLQDNAKSGKFKIFIWEENSSNISDSEDLKLIILKYKDDTVTKNILKYKGEKPRVYLNTLFFLCPLDSERINFLNTLKRKIAYKHIEQDKTLTLSDEQKKEIKTELKKIEESLKDAVQRLYRLVYVPLKNDYKEIDLGIPTYGDNKTIDQNVYKMLNSQGDIIEKIAPLVIKTKYLCDKEYIKTEQIYNASLKTPGEVRIINKSVIENGIIEGVKNGLFGIGELKNEKPICMYFNKIPTVSFSYNEILINESLCKEEKKEETSKKPQDIDILDPTPTYIPKTTVPHPEVKDGTQITYTPQPTKNQLSLTFALPKGKVSGLLGIMNLLQNKFTNLEITINANNGEISQQEYEDTIKEAFIQMGVELKQSLM